MAWDTLTHLHVRGVAGIHGEPADGDGHGGDALQLRGVAAPDGGAADVVGDAREAEAGGRGADVARVAPDLADDAVAERRGGVAGHARVARGRQRQAF